MRSLKPLLAAFAVLVAVPIVVDATIQTQRAQQPISITINVTADLGADPVPSQSGGASGIVAKLTRGALVAPSFQAENVAFQTHDMIAQATNQGSILVRAEVSPNPSGTLLYGNDCSNPPAAPVPGQCSGVSITQAAGSKTVYHCIYEVVVDTTQASWTLDSGLFTDFFPQGSGSGEIAGTNVGYNGYISTATPKPTATPFIVFSDGTNWTTFAANADAKTYCVDLTVTIPAATAVGTYGSQAVYTLYY
jgi:hypothetical protein